MTPQPYVTTTSQEVPGGTLYISTVATPGNANAPVGVAQAFVPGSASPQPRFLALTDAKSDAGIPLGATAADGAMGVARTPGASLQLVGETTSGDAATDKALWEFDLPGTYIPGADIPVVINAVVTGDGTLTDADTTLTVDAYTETDGVEAALTVSAAQMIAPVTASSLTFMVTGSGLQPGQHILIELTMLVTSSAGANTGAINSASFGA
jgi:hypothetical protein